MVKYKHSEIYAWFPLVTIVSTQAGPKDSSSLPKTVGLDLGELFDTGLTRVGEHGERKRGQLKRRRVGTLLHCWWGHKTVQPLWKRTGCFLQRVKQNYLMTP